MLLLIMSLFMLFPTQEDLKEKLKTIRAFYFVDDDLASSGNLSLDQYEHINAYGFKHVINLLPGNQLLEKKKVESYGMSYTQIPVDFSNPTVDDFEKFKTRMQELKDQRIYIHCAANMRASAFVFTYRVTQLSVDKKIAKEHMDKVWAPTGQWNRFITEVLTKYDINPEYRTGNTLTMNVRNQGIAALKHVKSKDEIDHEELQQVAREFEREKEDINSSVAIFYFLSKHFPEEIGLYLNIGRLEQALKNDKKAITAFKNVLKIDAKNMVAQKTLGRLGVPEYDAYYNGVKYNASNYKHYAGVFYFEDWNRNMEISSDGEFLYIQPEWRQQKSKLYANPENELFPQDFFWKIIIEDDPDKLVLEMMGGMRHVGIRKDDK